jgi:hypothetical protein
LVSGSAETCDAFDQVIWEANEELPEAPLSLHVLFDQVVEDANEKLPVAPLTLHVLFD